MAAETDVEKRKMQEKMLMCVRAALNHVEQYMTGSDTTTTQQVKQVNYQ